MKFLAPILVFMSLTTAVALADPSPAPSPSGVPVAVFVTPAAAVSPQVAVAEPSAPPAWAQDLMVTAKNLPVVGPVISKGLMYLGILSSVLTMLAAFLISALAAIGGALNYAGALSAAKTIADFQNGKFMYYIKFFSLFNAKKPEPL